MAEHTLTRTLTLGLPRRRVFEFFADAGNLERITPPELNFNIITPRPIDIGRGTLIDYKLRLRGLPITWRTEISVWDPPNEFVDRQLSGPYRQWVHRHTFTELGPEETLIEDEVRYRLPLEPLGDIAHFIVRRELEYIFDFRQRAVAEMLGNVRSMSAENGTN
jgi:ligand-binding SRPBCC domain-containing protein